MLLVPDGLTADQLWSLLLSTGKQLAKPSLAQETTLEKLEQDYFLSYPEGSKEESSLSTERTHIKHFKNLLGATKSFARIGVPELRRYVRRRQQERGLRGQKVAAATINKELQTFRLWGNHQGGRQACWPARRMSWMVLLMGQAA
jgi:hypothetical protein